MADRAFIIHGYLGYPDEAWMPWLKRELDRRGFEVSLPAMPHPDRPIISEWVEFIARLVGEPDSGTVLVAHSLGTHAVFHYLDRLGRVEKSVGKTVIIAGTFPLGLQNRPARNGSEVNPILLPWFAAAADPKQVKRAAGICTVILSEDDPYIPFDQAKASFPPQLGARIIVESGKGHFNEDDNVSELPAALEAVLS